MEEIGVCIRVQLNMGDRVMVEVVELITSDLILGGRKGEGVGL